MGQITFLGREPFDQLYAISSSASSEVGNVALILNVIVEESPNETVALQVNLDPADAEELAGQLQIVAKQAAIWGRTLGGDH
jgi:hypothetical protein